MCDRIQKRCALWGYVLTAQQRGVIMALGKDKSGRGIILHFRISPEEGAVITEKMGLAGITSLSAYLRKMAIDGYVIKLDLPELREMVPLLRRSSNNLNQIARRVNSTCRMYSEDMAGLMRQQQELWNCSNAILTKLASIE